MTKLDTLQRWGVRILLILTILSLQSWDQPSAAQVLPPPQIFSLSPTEGWPGDRIEVTIQGTGFDEEAEVIIESVELEVVRRSPQTLLIRLFIPRDAPPGPRDVIVINHVGQAQEAMLPGGFTVLGEAPVGVRLEGIEPSEAERGQGLSIMLWGEGFVPEMEIDLGEGVIEESREFVDDGTMRLQVRILDDAPVGARDVVVSNYQTQSRDALRRGFTVLGGPVEPGPTRVEPRPTEPYEGGDGGIPWEFVGPLLGLLAVVGVPVAAYLTWDAARRRKLTRERQQLERWQEEAQQELPRDCQPGAKLPIVGRKVKAGTWEIVHLVFFAELSAAGQPYADQHFVGGKIVWRLNEIVALRKRTGDEDRLRRMAAPLAQELARLLWVWGRREWQNRSVDAQASVEGKVTYEFKLYECQQTDEGNRWQKVKDWQGAIKETRELLAGRLVGPRGREGKGAFQRRAAEALMDHLLALTLDVSSIE